MGRIKTQMTKRITQDMMEKYSDKFKDNFEENKKIVNQLTDVKSKKIRNVIAGYATRLTKNKEQ